MRFLSLKHFKLLPMSCPYGVLENREQQDSLFVVCRFLPVYLPSPVLQLRRAGSTGTEGLRAGRKRGFLEPFSGIGVLI